MQAKDIDDAGFLRQVEHLSRTQPDIPGLGPWPLPRWVNRWEFDNLGPSKVVLAKAKKLIGRGLMRGCACGCRGDFELTDSGCEFIHPQKSL